VSIRDEELFDHLGRSDYQPQKSRRLAKELAIPEQEYGAFRKRLQALEKEGKLARLKGGRWALPETKGEITGVLEVTRRGFGFVLPDDARRDDIFVPAHELGDALNGDRVAIRLERKRGRDPRHYGSVVRILERSTTRLVGTVEVRRKKAYLHPEDERLPGPFEIREDKKAPEFHPDDKVLLQIQEWPKGKRRGAGVVIERLGPAGEPDTETAAILASFGAPGPFPEEVLEEVRGLRRTLSAEEAAERLDLRETVCFTIDPEDARDFDDAISLERVQDGYSLGVHIADVSQYVRPGSALDQEARARSTSIYLPGRVIPMLPPELCNDICSLRPEEDRPALSVLMELDRDGRIRESRIARTRIHSNRRFSYEEVKQLLEDRDKAASFEDQGLLSRLRMLRTIAGKMRERRLAEGSIELALPEHKVIMDDHGEATGLLKVEHDFSHQMIEDCMLAANVEVARYAAEHVLGILYRVHDAPEEEALGEMMEFLQAYGYNLRPPFDRHRLNRVLQEARGRPEEHAVNLAVLKSMQQAVYSPERRQHFALAFASYTHFTSPIRRYPDLYLHQVLKGIIPDGEAEVPRQPKTGGQRGAGGKLSLLGSSCSTLERRAEAIEREVKDLRRLELLAKCDRKLHRAVVTGVRKFGVFVEIEEYFVDALLHVSELEEHGRAAVEVLPEGQDKSAAGGRRAPEEGFHLGQTVLVEIESIDMASRRMTVSYAGEPED
jgi:ribonuclease R